MKTIVALVDFTEVTSKILKLAEQMSLALKSELVLLHIVPPVPVVSTLGADAPAIPEPPDKAELESHKAQLQDLLDSMIMAGVRGTALQFEGPVVETAAREVERMRADLVIMGAHHHNAFYNLLIRSVTSDMLKALPCPLMLVPAGELREEYETAMPQRAEELQQKVMTQPVLTV